MCSFNENEKLSEIYKKYDMQRKKLKTVRLLSLLKMNNNYLLIKLWKTYNNYNYKNMKLLLKHYFYLNILKNSRYYHKNRKYM